MRSTYHSHEELSGELQNTFKYMRIAILAIEPPELPWGIRRADHSGRVARDGIANMTLEDRDAEIEVLKTHGTEAWECVQNAKPVLQTLLERMHLEYTEQELDSIYSGLKDFSCDATVIQFDKELRAQTSLISQSRNRSNLLARWKNLTARKPQGMEQCRGIPLLWIVAEGRKRLSRR
jgi:hypothetical protein